MKTLEWRQKALLLCFYLYPYFWFPDLTLLRFLMVWPCSIRGEPKIQAILGSALLRFSYTTIFNRVLFSIYQSTILFKILFFQFIR